MEDSKSRTIFSTLEDAKAMGTGMLNRTLDLLAQIPQKIQSHTKLVDEPEHGLSSPSLIKKEKMPTWNNNVEKQLRTWKENPEWVDHSPEIKITVPKGSLCNLSVKFKVGLPPDAIYNIVTDPNNKRVFKNIKEVISRKVLLDEGLRQVVEVEQAALWRFLWWSGTISVHVYVDQNRENHTVSFKQGKSGFMKRFEGCWTLQPLLVDEELCSDRPANLTDYESCSRGRGRVGSLVSLEQLIQPSVVPPPPISWYLRGITARTTEMLIDDLLAEAARVRECRDDKITQESDMDNRGGEGAQHYYDGVKERWQHRQRRRISRS